MAASRSRSISTLPTSKTSPAMIRIDRNSANTKIYAYEIKQSVLKNFFLLLQTTPRLTALRTVNFPAITRNGFCFHIRKIISRPPGPPRKNRDIHIVGFFVDSIYSTTIDIITNNILFSIFKQGLCVYPARRLTVRICRYRSSRPAGWRSEFACIFLDGPPAYGTLLQKNYSRPAG